MQRLAYLAAIALIAAPAFAADIPDDPMKSPLWKDMAGRFLTEGAHPIVFDPAVKVSVPPMAENAMAFPVTVDASALEGVSRIFVFADIAPIPEVLTYEPVDAVAYLSFRFKVEQATPLRAAALAADGRWHVGSAMVNAAGGGCTAPSAARADLAWPDHLGEVRARAYTSAAGESRLRFTVRHPMDTGLGAMPAPAFYIEKIDITAPDGHLVGRLNMREPVEADPTFTLRPHTGAGTPSLTIRGMDTDGNGFEGTVPVPGRSSALPVLPGAG